MTHLQNYCFLSLPICGSIGSEVLVPRSTHTHLGEVESWEDPFLALTVLCRARTDRTVAGSALQL